MASGAYIKPCTQEVPSQFSHNRRRIWLTNGLLFTKSSWFSKKKSNETACSCKIRSWLVCVQEEETFKFNCLMSLHEEQCGRQLDSLTFGIVVGSIKYSLRSLLQSLWRNCNYSQRDKGHKVIVILVACKLKHVGKTLYIYKITTTFKVIN